MAFKRISVAGAGSLGIPVVKALTEAGFLVTVLTRSATPTKVSVSPGADVKYTTVDYKSVESLTQALQGHFGVVCTIAPTSSGEQGPLIEAAVAAGVQRFLPAEFGADMNNANTRALPVFQGKAMMEEEVAAAAAANPDFTYTLVFNGAFLDWGIEYSFLLDAKNRATTIFDDGNQKFSTTTLASVAKAVVGIFQHLDETKNRAVYIQDAALSQNELLQIAKKVDPQSKEWNVQRVSLKRIYDDAMDALARNESGEEVEAAMFKLIWPSLVGPGYGGDFSGRTDNALLGLQEMSEHEIEQVVAGCL